MYLFYLYRYVLGRTPIYAYPYVYIDVKLGHTRPSIFVYMHTQVWMYAYPYTNMNMRVCLHISVHACGLTHMDDRIWISAYGFMHICNYGVATISRMLKNMCLFAEYRSLL